MKTREMEPLREIQTQTKYEEKHAREASQRTSARRKRKLSAALTDLTSKPSPSKRMHKGFSFIGKRVIIDQGRHKGERGHVTRGANGYYCVEMDGGGTCWKRASSLSRAQKSAKAPSSSHSQGPAARDAASSEGGGLSSRREGPKGRSRNQDAWMSRRVRVKAGKYEGSDGIIRNSGHGYYCVDLPAVGPVMIRGFQLELIEEDDEGTEDEFELSPDEQAAASPVAEAAEAPEAEAEAQDRYEGSDDDSVDPRIDFAASVLVDMLSGMEAMGVESQSVASSATDTDGEDLAKGEHGGDMYEIQTFHPQQGPPKRPASYAKDDDRKTRFMAEVSTPLHEPSTDILPKFAWDLPKAIRRSAVDLTSFAW